MTARPIDIVRRIYAAWATGDFAVGADLWDDASVFILQPEFADAGTYVGPEQMERYMRSLLEPWKRLTIEALALSEAGDTVVAEVEQSGAGERSGAMTSFTYFQVWTFRGGILMRLENFMEREQVRKALGADLGPATPQA